jgi:hypothetical protein
MADKSSDLVQGTLDMLILKTLALESMHGYGVCRPHRTDKQGRVPRQCGFLVCCLPAVATSRTDQERMESYQK